MNSEQLKSFIVGIVLTMLGGLAAKLGLDAATTTTIATAIASLLMAGGLIIWRMVTKSDNAIISAAAKIIAPTGGVIQTTPAKAIVIPDTNVVTKP